MASHLTVTTTPAGAGKSVTAPFGADAEAGEGDVFAALLGTAAPQTTDTARTSATTADYNVGNLVNLSLGFGGSETGENEDPDAIAAVIDAVVPIQDAVEAVPALADIVNGLADLQARLAAGEQLDEEALKRLEAALADLTALTTDIQPDNTSFAARLAAAFGPLAETLVSGSAAPAEAGAAEFSAVLKSIGDKLAALLSAMNSGEIDPQELARLELAAQADADLDAALAKLQQPALAVKAGDATPALPAPELKLTEPALTGKANATPDTPADVETPDAAGQASAGETAPQDRKPTEQRPAPVGATVDKQPEPQTAAPQVPAARAEAVAPPRVVQAGYQTSQQQLNLPQLAFELVRQVDAGNTRFQIRLDPPELGRIDVKLDIDSAGQVNARLTVEKSETLDLMQRDQRALERALQQAGLEGNKTNLEFSLKQNPFSSGQQGEQGGNGRNPTFSDEVPADAEDTPPPTVNLYRGSLSASGVNIVA